MQDKTQDDTSVNIDEENPSISNSLSASNSIPVQQQNLEREIMEKECSCKGSSMPNQQPNYIYALGSIRINFPNVTIEKEYRQVLKEERTETFTDAQVLYQVLKNNRYLSREVCWILNIEGIDLYILVPRDPMDLDQLVESINRQDREPIDTQVVIGERGSIAPIELCGLELPILLFDKIYSFKRKELIEEIPKPGGVDEKQFRISSDDLFYRIQQMADNVGSSDEHRALNYLAVRYPQIYVHARQMYNDDYSLESIETATSRLSGTRKLIDVISIYQNRKTSAIERYYVRVDVTGKYPFLQNPLTRYFERV